LRAELAGELDDEDRVLRGEADGGEEADLEVHVVGEAEHEGRDDGPGDPERDDEHDGEGIDQLSYSAARQRKTTSSETA
jgi:hypothetical protein